MHKGLIAETSVLQGANGEPILGYSARPLGPGPFPGVVVVHHAPGLDEETMEQVRKLAHHGFLGICPNLYSDALPPIDLSDSDSVRRYSRGLSDQIVIGYIEAACRYLQYEPHSNGKVGTIGFCSGGRYAYLAACKLKMDAVVDCYGGSVVAGPERLSDLRPVAPIDLTASLGCPLLGIFGRDDPHVPLNHLEMIEDQLNAHGKRFEFKIYENAGHAFLGHQHSSYRVDASNDAWKRILEFFEAYLV